MRNRLLWIILALLVVGIGLHYGLGIRMSRESIHISVIGRLLLVVVFDERSTLGLVKLRSKQVAQQLSAMIEEITQAEFDAEDSPFAEITDEDIDSLFK